MAPYAKDQTQPNEAEVAETVDYRAEKQPPILAHSSNVTPSILGL